MNSKSNVVPISHDRPPAMSDLSAEERKLAEIFGTDDRQELAALAKQKTRRQKTKAGARLKRFQTENGDQVAIDHKSDAAGYALFMESVGTSNPDFAQGLIRQIVNTGSQGKDVDEEGSNFVLSVIAGIEPRDQVEAMLATQMAAVHLATMTFSRRLAHVENLHQQDAAEKAFNKLARTFTTQVEALKRYRSKGEQRVYVERVNVEPGGQAVVGNVSRGEG